MNELDNGSGVDTNYEEGNEVPEANMGQTPELGIGLTPFGLIGLSITDEEGTKSYIIKSPDEAWRVAGHLSSLATMLVQSMYAQIMQEKEIASKLMAEVQGKKVWTPGG